MRAPPPVRIACAAGGRWAALQAAIAAAAWAVAIGWLMIWFDWGILPVFLALLLSLGFLARPVLAWIRRPALTLEWDGQAWRLDGLPGRPEVMMDLGAWMLLRFSPGPGAARCWLGVSAAAAGRARHLWWAALYSSVAQPPSTSR